jgi:hypothetical protein
LSPPKTSDFAGGDSGILHDSIVRKLFTLSDEILIFPAELYLTRAAVI